MNLAKLSFILTAAAAGLLSFGLSPATAAPEFYRDYHSGVAAAKASNKPMVVVFSAAWCGPCQQMKQAVYPSAPVATYHDDFVWVYVDIDDPRNTPVVSQHRVGPIPHISFKNASGKSVDTLKGAVPPSVFAERLEKVQKKTDQPSSPASGGASVEEPKKKGFNLFKRKDSA